MVKLTTIVNQHPVLPHIIKYREMRKSITSYGENWIEYVNENTGRIHGNLHQIGTLTGRYVANDPILLGIPREDSYRHCFEGQEGVFAKDGWLSDWQHTAIVSADYSQIELRILAEFSNDENMIRAFREGKDLHTFTASLVFNVPISAVTKLMRQRAKDLNFGIVFGIGAKRFADNSGISIAEAKKLMANYFSVYRGLDRYLKAAARQARVFRNSRTASNRLIRYNFNDSDDQAVAMAERNGKNTPIQGTSADITKMALRLVYERTRGTLIKMVLSVHDELVTECPDTHYWVTKTKSILVSSMEEAALKYVKNVPIKIDTNVGWYWSK